MHLPAVTAEQRAHVYKDVEELIAVGFLSHPVRVGKHQMVLRSLLDGDNFLLRHRAHIALDWQAWTLASSVWMVDGLNLLGDPAGSFRMAQVFRRVPKSIMEALFGLALGLFRRANKAFQLVEAFCYEEHSRYLWRTYGRKVPVEWSGIPGRERLGMNSIQGIWLAFNEAEDDRMQQQQLWEAAKMIASSMSPKGVQKVDASDKQRLADEKARRERFIQRSYYVYKGVITDDGQFTDGTARTLMQGAHTAEELADEMERWVKGEEDWHDRVVSAYKKRITDTVAAQKRAHQERMVTLQQVAAQREAEDPGPMPLVAYTQEQLAEILRSRRGGLPGTRQIYPDHDPRQRLHERYLAQKAGAPQPMVATADGGLSPLQAAIDKRGVPFQTGGRK